MKRQWLSVVKGDQPESRMSKMDQTDQTATSEDDGLEELTIKVSADLYRAYQRCTWILINETGRDQLEIMDEMVRDFLVKHGC
jgi:hypothetical protein